MLRDIPPTVSVIMPVYQQEDLVAEAIGSVLRQTFSDFELIIVDDGSTDRSMQICASFEDPRIRIVQEPHRGAAGARNTGFLHARGEYVAMLECTDSWAKDKLEAHIAHLASDPGLGASTSGVMTVDEAGQPTGQYRRPKTGPVSARDVFCGRVIMNISAPVFRWEMLVESALPEDASGRHWVFDERLRRSEDVECWTRLAVTSRFRIEAIDRPLTFARAKPAGQPSDTGRALEAWDEACDRIAHIAPEFIAECGAEARGQKLRSLARSCMEMNEGALGLSLARDAVEQFPALLWREPAATAAVFLRCAALRVLPHRTIGSPLLVAA